MSSIGVNQFSRSSDVEKHFLALITYRKVNINKIKQKRKFTGKRVDTAFSSRFCCALLPFSI